MQSKRYHVVEDFPNDKISFVCAHYGKISSQISQELCFE
jgi:hypothetical protein